MIDLATLVVTALTRALLAGVEEVGREAAKDAYHSLKALLVRRYGRTVESGITYLEAEPTSSRRQDDVVELFRRSGLNDDPDLRTAAAHLLAEIDGPPPPDPIELPRRTAGVRAVSSVLGQHVQVVEQLRSSLPVDDGELLSTSYSRSIPSQTRTQLLGLHARIRQIIQQVAQDIEDAKYRDTESAIRGLHSMNERQRATRLVQADKQLHVSYETLRLTVEFFSQINEDVISRIEQEHSSHRLSNMMFGNAVLIYELTNSAIEYIENFLIDGAGDLQAIHAEMQERIARARSDQQRLAESAHDENIEQSVRTSVLRDVEHRDAAITTLEEEWAAYVQETDQFHTRVGEVAQKLPTLRLIRDNARVQLNVLELVAMLRFLRQNSDALRATIDSLKSFRLAPLTPTRVRRLLNIRE